MRLGIFGSKRVLHHPGPDSARSSEFTHFLEKVIVGIEEKTQPGSKIVNLESAI